MTPTKYDDNVKTLKFRAGRGGANARELVFVSGEELGGFELNFIIGVYDQTGDWAPGRGAHVHPFDECLLFFGYDDNDLGYLGSDMELAMGPELEKHEFSVPTVVAAPGGMPHCPLVTRRVHKPFGHFHLALNAKYTGSGVEPSGTTDGNKYTHLFRTMTPEAGPGGGGAAQSISVSGRDLQGFNINFTLSLHQQAGDIFPGKGSRVNPHDECLIFFGHKTDDLSYLGAEISIELGPEHEKHTFDVPTVVAVPAGLPHFPLTCRSLERPYGIMRVGLGPEEAGSWEK